MIRTCYLLVLLVFCPIFTSAQNTAVSGQIIGSDGTPWAGLEVSIQNIDTGERSSVRTDKEGRYGEWGIRPGTYRITIFDPNNKSFSYSETHALHGAQGNEISMNFSTKNKAEDARSKNEEEDAVRFNRVKAHFNTGLGAMLDAETLRKRLLTARSSEIAEIQNKIDSDYNTAISEFQLAESTESPIDIKTRAMIWGHLGEVYDDADQYGEATRAYEKAIALAPEAVDYQNLSKIQASIAVRSSDHDEIERLLSAADGNCSKAEALNPEIGAKCWRNLGVLLSNKGDMRNAIPRWEKTTEITPRDAEAWFQLGRALISMDENRSEDNVHQSAFSSRAVDAFRKCIEVDPHGPYAEQAAEILAELQSASGAGH
jgi:tetratricopeptide (TPR) repeat protein